MAVTAIAILFAFFVLTIFGQEGGADEDTVYWLDTAWLRLVNYKVSTPWHIPCFITYFTLNETIIYRRIIWDHKLIRKIFPGVINQVRCSHFSHKLTYDFTISWNQFSLTWKIPVETKTVFCARLQTCLFCLLALLHWLHFFASEDATSVLTVLVDIEWVGCCSFHEMLKSKYLK